MIDLRTSFVRTAVAVLILAGLSMLSSCSEDIKSKQGEGAGDQMTVDMAPMRVIGLADDGLAGMDKYPFYEWRWFPQNSTSVLARILDPYGAGDFYSVKVHSSFNIAPHSGAPAADDAEPDNTPADANALTYGTYLDRGLNPAGDEDWFSYDFAANPSQPETWIIKGNASGTSADPVLEVYDPELNPGALTLTKGPGTTIFGNPDYTNVIGVHDPSSGKTLIAAGRFLAGCTLSCNSGIAYFYAIVFSGPQSEGSHTINDFFPPVSDSVSGTVTVSQYNSTRIAGTFSATMIAGSQTTTVSGTFNVPRLPDEPGLLNAPVSAQMDTNGHERVALRKAASGYLRRLP